MFFYYLNSGISNNKHELILVAVPANVAIHYFSSKLTNKWHHHSSCVCFFKTLDNFKNVPLAETRTLINKMGSLKSSILIIAKCQVIGNLGTVIQKVKITVGNLNVYFLKERTTRDYNILP